MNNEQLLEQLLLDRTNCTQWTLKLIAQYQKPVITFSLNIPGLIKNNLNYTKFFHKYYQLFLDFLTNNFIIIYQNIKEDVAGNYGWIIVNEFNGLKIKAITYQFERLFKDISSLFDLDVYDLNNLKITREKLNLEPRKCYLCENNAKLCARMQKHSLIKLETYVKTLINNDLLK